MAESHIPHNVGQLVSGSAQAPSRRFSSLSNMRWLVRTQPYKLEKQTSDMRVRNLRPLAFAPGIAIYSTGKTILVCIYIHSREHGMRRACRAHA